MSLPEIKRKVAITNTEEHHCQLRMVDHSDGTGTQATLDDVREVLAAAGYTVAKEGVEDRARNICVGQFMELEAECKEWKSRAEKAEKVADAARGIHDLIIFGRCRTCPIQNACPNTALRNLLDAIEELDK